MNDLEVLKLVGYPIVPQDANEKIKDITKGSVKKEDGKESYKRLFLKYIKMFRRGVMRDGDICYCRNRY